jgi:aspartyl-tRNA synthetase
MMRTHNCGELRREEVGQDVTLTGWVHIRRDLGGVIFVDLRDRYGITQLVFNPDFFPGAAQLAVSLRHEFVIEVKGQVKARPEEMVNKDLATGAIEILVSDLKILSRSEVLPFEINNEEAASLTNEALRLEYRFLDLRRAKLQKMLKTKDEFFTYLREYFHEHNFVEVQTPILANSSPEGARDFLIPSRLYPGKFYALPQAPQQFKQLLMVGGVDRYFQVAPCFRDEDTRLDRHYGEFYQLDMEMSFAGQDDVFAIMEPLMKEVTKRFSSKELVALGANGHFQQIPWRQALEKYGSDKPDLRYDLEIKNISEICKDSGFEAFDTSISNGGVVLALVIDNASLFSRKVLDELKEKISRKKTSAFASLSVEADSSVKSSLSKFLSPETLSKIAATVTAQAGQLVLLLSGEWREACEAMGIIRVECAKRLELLDPNKAAYCWITDFPMYEYSELKPGTIDFGHNPFSMPQGGMDAINSKHPLEILAYQYDLVLNGFEVSSGAVRNHEPELLYKVFEIAGYEKEEVDRRFGGMIKAFKFGAPPHAGNAPGVDRILMVLNEWDSIRDMYAFPKDGQGRDLLMGSPSDVDDEQIKDLHIKSTKK